jgi:para-aminobenzoate synthetase component 1
VEQWVTPSGDFDFNVIRIFVQSGKSVCFFFCRSAITALSIPESEYEECLLKAKAVREVLQ